MSEPIKTQLLVIGAGPGGYMAAFHAADKGMDVTLVDTQKTPGGVCLYRGCIPTKALLHAAQILSDTKAAREIGIAFPDPAVDLKRLNDWKNGVVTKLTGGLGQLTKQRKIRFIQGKAALRDSATADIETVDGSRQEVSFDRTLIATGSAPVALPFAPSSPRVLDSTSALDVGEIPRRLLIIGGGYIGLEFATVYSELGAEVSVVEMTDGLLPGVDRDLVRILQKQLTPRLKSVRLNTRVVRMQDSGNGITVSVQDRDGKETSEEYEKVLVAVGRKPLSQGLGLETTKARTDERGFIVVNGQRQTSDPNIYAIGDVAGQPMLAHKASHEAAVAARAIAGENAAFAPKAIPSVVYTNPEIVWAGLTEDQARQQNRPVKISKRPWMANGRAVTINRTDGVTKLIFDPESRRLLGLAIVGVGASELLAEGVLALEMGAAADDLKSSIHPHPTLSETIMEAAESVFGYRPKGGRASQ